MGTKAVEFVVSGEVQGVGYREFVAKVGRKLKLVGFVENLEDGTVRIRCKGEDKIIGKFRELIDVKKPSDAPLIEVEKIAEKQIEESLVVETIFKQKPGELAAEMMQGFSTGMKYLNHVGMKVDSVGTKVDSVGMKVDVVGAKVDSVGMKVDVVGAKVDSVGMKVDVVGAKVDGVGTNVQSVGAKMDSVGAKIDQFRNETVARFDRMDEKYGRISTAMLAVVQKMDKKNHIFESKIAKTEQNIETLLKVLVKRKGN